MTSEVREKLLKQKEDIQKNIVIFSQRVKEEEENLKFYEKQVRKSEERVAIVKSNLNEAIHLRNQQELKLGEARKTLSDWNSALILIDERINEITSPNLYLIAPGYNGIVPATGRLRSVVPFKRAAVEYGRELYKEPSIDALLDSGFENVKDLKAALDFARLVVLYDSQDAEFEVLVDDARIIKILKDQGLNV